MDKERITALVMAGGRFHGRNAIAAETNIKALARFGDATLLTRVLHSLKDVSAVHSIVVVGPEDVAAEARAFNARWLIETSSLLGNVQAGASAEGVSNTVLLVGSDLAAPQSESLADFIARSPEHLAVTVPLVERRSFEAAFPSCPGVYVPLREGEFTIGSQFLAPVSLLLNPTAGMAAILGHRKSQLHMARTLGWPVAWGLLRRTLTIPQLEARATAVLGVPSGGVLNCGADLAFDIDDASDLVYARRLYG